MLRHDRVRLIVSSLGITFAVLLMFAELGFLNGVYDSVTVPIKSMDADLVVVHSAKENTFPPTPFPLARIAQARSVAGVTSARPLYVRNRALWRIPGTTRLRPVRVFGFDPRWPAFNLPGFPDLARRLRERDTILFDADARPIYGAVTSGVEGELDDRRVRVVGTFAMGPDLAFFGNAMASEETFLRLAQVRRDEVEFGLITLAADAEAPGVQRALRQALPSDVAVYGREQLVSRLQSYWRKNEPAGAVFSLGMAVGFAIGVMICSQILFTQVSDHFRELAILRALGHADGFLVSLVLQQAIILAVLGFVPGWIASAVGYRFLADYSGIQMWLTPPRVATVFALTLLLCTISAGLAVRKALRADPAELY